MISTFQTLVSGFTVVLHVSISVKFWVWFSVIRFQDGLKQIR